MRHQVGDGRGYEGASIVPKALRQVVTRRRMGAAASRLIAEALRPVVSAQCGTGPPAVRIRRDLDSMMAQ